MIEGKVAKFRSVFKLGQPITRWFPGHMVKGMKMMQKKLSKVDCVIEVHDSRIPFSGRNPNLNHLISVAKPHLLILNKKDLVDTSMNSIVERQLMASVTKVIYTNLKGDEPSHVSNYDSIIPTVIDMVQSGERYNRIDCPEINVMIIGIPNVGKSCLINRLRQSNYQKFGRAAQVGMKPGVTRAVMEKIKINTDPPMYVLDTPGILEPKGKNIISYMRLAAVNAISDDAVGIQNIADYILFWLNSQGHTSYVDYFDLPNASDSITEVLFQMAMKHKLYQKGKDLKTMRPAMYPDMENAAKLFISSFRSGELGLYMLDQDLILNQFREESNSMVI